MNAQSIARFTLCGGGDIAAASIPSTLDNLWTHPFHLFPDTVCFVGYGWMFFVLAGASLVTALGCILASVACSHGSQHRFTIYSLILASTVIRGSYCAEAFRRILFVPDLNTFRERDADWFLTYTLPANAAADLLAACADLLLVWLFVRANATTTAAVLTAPQTKWLRTGCRLLVGSFVACLVRDYTQLERLKVQARHRTMSGIEIWAATLLFVGIFVGLSSVLQSVLFIEVAGVTSSCGLLHPRTISGITVFSNFIRAMCLLLRFVGGPFRSGIVSFNSPAWTAMYYIGFGAVPTALVAFAVAFVHAERPSPSHRGLLGLAKGPATV